MAQSVISTRPGTYLKVCTLCNNMAIPIETCYDGEHGRTCPRYKAAIAKSPVEWVTIDP